MIKGLTGVWWIIPCLPLWERWVLTPHARTVHYSVYWMTKVCLHGGEYAHSSACLLSPFPQFCSLADCSAPSLVAAPPSSPSQWCWALVPSRDTLTHSLVTEQRGWGWTTGDPDMRTCNEVHCHNLELQHPGSATRQLKRDVQPWVIENCWVSYGGTNIQLTTCIDNTSMQITNLFIYHSSQTSSSLLEWMNSHVNS